jgi:HAD superfamily hydrolase (TIGR01509 family)
MRGVMVQYPFMMFDWGDTVMKDDPTLDTPMYQWPTVETIDGAEEVLRTLHAQRTIIMATGAAQSDEVDIRLALQRVNLDNYFDHIFCFKNTGLRKPSEDFYRYILEKLNARPSDILMVADNFESDILGANYVGISGVWLNQKDTKEKRGEHFSTIHRLLDLLLFFKVV